MRHVPEREGAAHSCSEAAIEVARTGGATMRQGSSPANLHERAREIWQISSDLDDLSRRYEETDAAIAARRAEILRVVSRRPTRWVNALHRYEEFWRLSGRAPRENSSTRSSIPGEERRLGEWARYQRRAEASLSGYQRVRLDVSPAFEWDPLESRWLAKIALCAIHLQHTARLPFLNPDDSVEFALARWLGRQLRELRSDTLPISRVGPISLLLEAAAKCRKRPSS